MIHVLLVLLAFLCSLLAAFGVKGKTVDLLPLGLAFWFLSLLIAR